MLACSLSLSLSFSLVAATPERKPLCSANKFKIERRKEPTRPRGTRGLLMSRLIKLR